MKTFAAFGTTFLFLLLTVSVPRLIAQEHENERNGAKSEQQQDENRQPTARPQSEPQRDENKQPTATPGEDRRHEPSTQEPRANRPDQERSDQEKTRQPEATHPQHEQAEPNESRPAKAQRGKRIPDDQFRASFGRHHTFRLRRDEVINNPRPVITYSGYSFELLEPWPQEWSFDDDCYIDYVDDQYYLFTPVHPGMRMALIVVNVD